jgi:hypothetical protein
MASSLDQAMAINVLNVINSTNVKIWEQTVESINQEADCQYQGPQRRALLQQFRIFELENKFSTGKCKYAGVRDLLKLV